MNNHDNERTVLQKMKKIVLYGTSKGTFIFFSLSVCFSILTGGNKILHCAIQDILVPPRLSFVSQGSYLFPISHQDFIIGHHDKKYISIYLSSGQMTSLKKIKPFGLKFVLWEHLCMCLVPTE